MTAALGRISEMAGDTIPTVADDLHDLPPVEVGWCRWPHWHGLVRRVDDVRWMAVIPFIYTDAIAWGYIGDTMFYEDRWCYDSPDKAIIYGSAWDGNAPYTEPEGWHRHPRTGRRRTDGDVGTEYVSP